MKQGEIVLINLDPTTGAEIKKTRPEVIINHNSLGKLPLKIIVPITEWKEKYEIVPWMVKLDANDKSGLSKLSSADRFQIRSVAQERFISKLGVISAAELNNIKKAVTKVLSLDI